MVRMRRAWHLPAARTAVGLLLLVLLPLLSTASTSNQPHAAASGSVGRARQWPWGKSASAPDHSDSMPLSLFQKLGRSLVGMLRNDNDGDRPQRLRDVEAAVAPAAVRPVSSLEVTGTQHVTSMTTSRTGRALMQLNDGLTWYGYTFPGPACPPCAYDYGDQTCAPCDVSLFWSRRACGCGCGCGAPRGGLGCD